MLQAEIFFHAKKSVVSQNLEPNFWNSLHMYITIYKCMSLQNIGPIQTKGDLVLQ